MKNEKRRATYQRDRPLRRNIIGGLFAPNDNAQWKFTVLRAKILLIGDMRRK